MTVGVNINKNPASEGRQAVDDFLLLFTELNAVADYFTLNWAPSMPHSWRRSLPH